MKAKLSLLATVVLVVIGIAYLYEERQALAILKELDFLQLALLAVLLSLFFIATGYTFAFLVRLLDVRLTFTETVGLSILTNFSNYLAPTRPGSILKAVYLKYSRGLSFAYFGSVLAANLLVACFMTGIFALGLLAVLARQEVELPKLLWFISGGLTVGAVVTCLLPIPEPVARTKIGAAVVDMLAGFRVIRSSGIGLTLICVSFVAQFLLSAFAIKYAYQCLGVPLGLETAMFIGVFTALANLMTITPNNLGVQEAVVAYLIAAVGSDFSVGLIGATLLRVLHVVITFCLAPVFVHLLLRGTSFRWFGRPETVNDTRG